MRIFRHMLWLLLCLPALAAGEADDPALRAALVAGQSRFDAASGLVRDDSGALNIPEASAGYMAACLATGQDLDRARQVLDRIIAAQIASGRDAGLFPWAVAPEAPGSADATLYALPLLSCALRHHEATLGPDLTASLRGALERSQRALTRLEMKPADDARFLLRSAALATATAALGGDSGFAAEDAAQWLRAALKTGLPAGHSPTFDAVRLVALKWIWESVEPERRPAVEQALALASVDLAGRVHPPAEYLAGAMTHGFAGDYARASGFPSYVLHTDFGLPLPERVEPYLAAAALPQWHAPQSVRDVTGLTGMRRTRAIGAPVTATDTYVGQFFSLGTMSGQVAQATIPIFATFRRTERPTMYFYCTPAAATVQSVQADNLALCSFNFDGVGTTGLTNVAVNAVLGTPEEVQEVYCYGVPWNGLPTSVGEMESIAVATEECFVGLTVTRTGAASSNQGAAARPAVLEWSEPNGAGNLMLTIRARPQEYPLPRPVYDMRAGVVIEVASRLAYPTLADFARHIGAGRVKQAVKSGRELVSGGDKPRDPNVLIPEPRSRGDRTYRTIIQQTIEYTNEGRSLKLVEDLRLNEALERQIDGAPLDATALWESDFFTWQPKGDLQAVLAPFMK